MKFSFSASSFTFLICLLCGCSNGKANQHNYVEGQGGVITNDGHFTEFIIHVDQSDNRKLTTEYGLKEVTIDLEHGDLSEIVMYLKAPDGSEVELTYVSGAGGTQFRNTCFADDAHEPIKCASPPFTGRFRPVDYLGSINNGQQMNGKWTLLVKDWKPSQFSGKLNSWKLTFGENAPSPVILTESELPVIVIDTKGKSIPDSPRISAEMGIVHNKSRKNRLADPFNGYKGNISIETRGSSSQNYSKKSYSISLLDTSGKKTDKSLLELPAEKDWILYAPYSDKTLLRNFLTYTLFSQMGHYAPRCRFAELVINGDYRGVYMLTEKIKRDKNRVNIAEPGKDTSLITGTGGYLLKIDRFESDTQGFYSHVPSAFSGYKKVFYSYAYPSEKAITPAQKAYIRNVIARFENILLNDSARKSELQHIADLKSFADYFIINEFSKNVDAYKLSTYLYKDNDKSDKRIHMGPVWDFDLAWNNANYGGGDDPKGWQYLTPDTVFPVPQWWEKLMNDPVFKKILKQRWQELRKGTLSTKAINSLIDKNTAMMKGATERNFKKWPVLGSQVGMNPLPLPRNYSEEVSRLKKWIEVRGEWMDNEIAGF